MAETQNIEKSVEMESKIKDALFSRASYFREQPESLTFEGVSRLLEKDLGLETHDLDTRKRFVKRSLQQRIESASLGNLTENQVDAGENVLSSTGEAKLTDEVQINKEVAKAIPGCEENMEDSPVRGLMTGPKKMKSDPGLAEDIKSIGAPSESTIKKAVWDRASYLTEPAQLNVTLAGVRRLLEEDLELEKHALDPFKKFINQQVEQVMVSPDAPEKTTSQKKTNMKKHASGKASSVEEDARPSSKSNRDEVEEDEVKVKKKSSPKGKLQKSDAIHTPESQRGPPGSSSGGATASPRPTCSTGGAKQLIYPNAGSFHPKTEASDHIGTQWQALYKAPWPTYSKFPEDVKEQLWENFRNCFTWDPTHEVMIHKNYDRILAKRVADMFNRAKKKGNMESDKWVKPPWMGFDVWDGLVEIWRTPDYHDRSERMRRNRRSDPEGVRLNEKAPVTHRSGARSFSENRLLCVAHYAREPTFEELYKWNHYSRKRRCWSANHEVAWDKYQEALSAYMVSHNLNEVPDNATCAQIWVAANTDKTGHVYGFGDDYVTVQRMAGQRTPRIVRDPSMFTIIPHGCNEKAFNEAATAWLQQLSRVDKEQLMAAMARDLEKDIEQGQPEGDDEEGEESEDDEIK